jgi:hypothetical protein
LLYPYRIVFLGFWLFLLVVYLVDVLRRTDMSAGQKVRWLLVLLMLNVWAMPVYWYLYLRPRHGKLFGSDDGEG